MESLYFDWNATTPPHPDVVRAMQSAAATQWANPASVHAPGRRARQLVDGVREALAALLGVHPRDVLFTAGGTEANNLALHAAPALVTSRLEHPSVTRAAERLEALGRPVVWLPVLPDGRVDAEALPEALAALPSGTVVAVMAANHETGVLQPLEAVAERVRAADAWLHVDAVQLIGKASLASLVVADSVTLSAHKFRGPKGIGALLWRRGPGPTPLLVGGAQQRGLRGGTEDPCLIAGFGVAVERLAEGPTRYARLRPLRDEIESALGHMSVVNGTAERLPHVTNLSLPGFRGDELVAALDLCGVCVASGSACSAGTIERSPVIEAMLGRVRAEQALRISMGEDTTGDQVLSVTRALTRIYRSNGNP